VVFDRQGMVVTGSFDGTLRRWLVNDVERSTLLRLAGLRWFASFSPTDRDLLLTNDGYDAALIDLDGRVRTTLGRQVITEPVATVAAAFAPRGDFVLTGSHRGTLTLWRSDGAEVWRHDVGAEVTAVAFGDGSSDAYAALKTRGTNQWQVIRLDWRDFDHRSILTADQRINSVAVSPGRIVTAEGEPNGSHGQVRVLEHGRPVLLFPAERQRARVVAFTPDRHTLLVGVDLRSRDERGTTAGFLTHRAELRGPALEILRVLGGHPHELTAAAFSHDGRLILTGTAAGASSGSAEVRLWSADARLLLSIPVEKEVVAVSFSADGSRFLAAEGEAVRVWLTAAGIRESLRTLDVDDLPAEALATIRRQTP
jgi:WD40 repeat protein